MRSEREKFEEWYTQQVCEIPKTICFSEKEGGYVINNAGLINEMNANILKNILNIGLYAWQAAKADTVPEGFVLVNAEQLSQWGHMANYAEQYGCPECFESRGYAHNLACEINEFFAVASQEPAND